MKKEFEKVVKCDELLGDKFYELELGEWVESYDGDDESLSLSEYFENMDNEMSILKSECYEGDEDFEKFEKFYEEVKRRFLK